MRIFCLLLLTVFTSIFSFAQTASKKITREEYIEQHKIDAVRDMLKTGVPASITLAQALLESDNGNSELAINANNHFGVKCHDWKGKKYYYDDDIKHECFRKYESILESYDDHSVFLKTRSRYAFLFDIPRTDYKNWAVGLKKAGYATAPDYAERLIKIIEENKLYELDKLNKISSIKQKPATPAPIETPPVIAEQRVLLNNDVKYIVARKGDTYLKIAQNNEMGLWQILKYNEIDKDTPLKEGQKIYLQPKRRKAVQEFHYVKKGETIYTISQLYAIKQKFLYHKNRMEEGQEPAIGQKLWLRHKKPKNDKSN